MRPVTILAFMLALIAIFSVSCAHGKRRLHGLPIQGPMHLSDAELRWGTLLFGIKKPRKAPMPLSDSLKYFHKARSQRGGMKLFPMIRLFSDEDQQMPLSEWFAPRPIQGGMPLPIPNVRMDLSSDENQWMPQADASKLFLKGQRSRRGDMYLFFSDLPKRTTRSVQRNRRIPGMPITGPMYLYSDEEIAAQGLIEKKCRKGYVRLVSPSTGKVRCIPHQFINGEYALSDFEELDTEGVLTVAKILVPLLLK